MGRRTPPPWLTTDLALSYFGSDRTSSILLLDAYVQAGIPKELDEVLSRKRWPAIIGVKTFVEEIRHRFRLGKPVHREKPQDRALLVAQAYSPTMVIMRVCKVFGVEASLIQKSKSKRNSNAKRAAIYFLRHACHLSYVDIGKLMGGLGDAGVYYHLDQLKQNPIQTHLWNSLCKEFSVGA